MYKELRSKYKMPKRSGLFRTKSGSTWMIRGTPITEQEAYDLLLTWANRHFDTRETRIENILFLLGVDSIPDTEDALKYLIERAPEREWKPGWVFSDAGNMITVFWQDCPTTAKWLNPYVQVFYKHDSPDIIAGCQIYGVYQEIEREFAKEARKHTELAVAVRKVVEANQRMNDDKITDDEFFDTIGELTDTYWGIKR